MIPYIQVYLLFWLTSDLRRLWDWCLLFVREQRLLWLTHRRMDGSGVEHGYSARCRFRNTLHVWSRGLHAFRKGFIKLQRFGFEF